MKTTNKLTVPDLISIGVFTALYFVLVTIATFGSAAIAPGFNNVILPAVCALISGCVYMLLAAKLQKFGGISVMGVTTTTKSRFFYIMVYLCVVLIYWLTHGPADKYQKVSFLVVRTQYSSPSRENVPALYHKKG